MSAVNEKTVIERFDQLWSEWGLRDASESGAQARRKAVTALETWLKDASKHPDRLIRAVQTLLANPESPSSPSREAVRTVASAVRDVWAAQGAEPARDLQFLQAMLLASWPAQPNAVLGLAQLMDSPWELMAGRAHQKKAIQAWRRSRARLPEMTAALTAFNWKPQLTWRKVGDVTVGTTRLHQNVSQETLTAKMSGHPGQMTIQNPQIGQAKVDAPSVAALTQVLTELQLIPYQQAQHVQAAINSLIADSNSALEHGTYQTLQALQSLGAQLEAIVNRPAIPPELPLLWWGQARYSFLAEQPFRRLKEPGVVMLLAVEEIAQRAHQLSPEPTCAYLLEFLHALGQNLEEQRTLADWTRELIEGLRECSNGVGTVHGSLAKLINTDALGLPITWLRLQAAGHNSDKKILAELENATQLSPSVRLDRGQWASWLLREWLLDYRWAQLFPKK